MSLELHISNHSQFQIQGKPCDKDKVYRFVVDGRDKGISDYNIMKVIKVYLGGAYVNLSKLTV